MKDAKRTPGPWTYEGTGNFIGGPDQQRVADVFRDNMPAEERQANAAFIVRACNTHDGLVGALQVMLRLLEGENLDEKFDGEAEVVRAALASAEGVANG